MSLPEGWVTARVDELAGPGGLVSDGDWVESKDQDANGSVRLTQLADVGEGQFRDKSARFMTEEAAQRLRCTFLEPGDALIARMPDPIGRACVFPGLDQPAVTAVDVMIWRTDGELAASDWFVRWINSPDVRRHMSDGAGGTTRQRIAGGRIKELELPLPPKAEQRRIVAKLDALTAHLARARAELDRVPVLADRLRDVVLTSTIAKLADYPMVSIADVSTAMFDGPFGSNLKSADYTASGARVVRLENIGHLCFLGDRQTYISLDKYEALTRHTLRAGDILFSSFVDREVRVCRFPEGVKEPTINKADCFVIRLNSSRCDGAFLTYLLAAPATYHVMKDAVHGATRPRIGLTQLKTYAINLPPVEEQRAIVAQLDGAFARADRLEAEAARARDLLDRLESAILAKAFRGELVPQDSNDEPASVLLERIRAQRAATPKAKRGRRVAGATAA